MWGETLVYLSLRRNKNPREQEDRSRKDNPTYSHLFFPRQILWKACRRGKSWKFSIYERMVLFRSTISLPVWCSLGEGAFSGSISSPQHNLSSPCDMRSAGDTTENMRALSFWSLWSTRDSAWKSCWVILPSFVFLRALHSVIGSWRAFSQRTLIWLLGLLQSKPCGIT